jgi:tRNA(Arg) A34 adenosine deaminase TadA
MKPTIKPNRREMRYFNLAKREATKSAHQKAKIGSVIVVGNYVAGRGFNHNKSHPVQARYDKQTSYYGCNAKLHSEIATLLNSGKMDLTGAEIYIYRVDKNGTLAPCRPCVSCTKALEDAGVSHIYYTSNEGFHYEQW